MRTIAQKILAVFLATFFVVSVAYAATSNLSGYGWAGQKDAAGNTVGVGWVNFSGVTMADVAGNGVLVGMADSENIGPINFAAAGCPTADVPGCVAGAFADWSNPNTDGSINVKGWARACSVYASGCSGVLADDAYRGTWDGWIALSNPSGTNWSGTNSVRFNPTTGEFSGYAWGDQVVGRLDFTGVKVTLDPSDTSIKLIPTKTIPAQGTIGSLSNSITVPSTTTTIVLSWYKAEASTIYTSCTVTSSKTATTWTQKIINSGAGNLVFGPTAHTSLSGVSYTSSNQTYTLSCVKTDGTTDTAIATVTDESNPPPPQCTASTTLAENKTCYCQNHAADTANCSTNPPPPQCTASTTLAENRACYCQNHAADTANCSTVPPYCTNLPRYTQITAPFGVIRTSDGKCSCPVGKVMKLLNGRYDCTTSHYEEH